MEKHVNALEIRQHFGRVLTELESHGEPIIIEKGRKPVAVLISIELFEKRFIDLQDMEKKKNLLKKFQTHAAKVQEDSLSVLRELRYG